jgi:prevent-host-death family protein
MPRVLPISEVKARLPELVTGVEDRGEEIVVTRKGKPAAVLVSHAEYERLKETLDVLSDPDLMRQIALSRAFHARGRPGLSFEDVFGEPVIPSRSRRRWCGPGGSMCLLTWPRSSAICPRR